MKTNKTNTIKKTLLKSIGNGCSISKACEGVKIARITFYAWIKTDKKFYNAIEKAKLCRIKVVEDALFKRATGYSYTEITKSIKDYKTVEKEIAPDVGAIIFFLCNRDSDNWQNTQKLVGDMNNPIPIIIQGVNIKKYPKQKEKSEK